MECLRAYKVYQNNLSSNLSNEIDRIPTLSYSDNNLIDIDNINSSYVSLVSSKEIPSTENEDHIISQDTLVVLNDCTDGDISLSQSPVMDVHNQLDSSDMCKSMESNSVLPSLASSNDNTQEINSSLNPQASPFLFPQQVNSPAVEMIDLDLDDDDDVSDANVSRPGSFPHNFQHSHGLNSNLDSHESTPITSDEFNNQFKLHGNSYNNNSQFVNMWSSRIKSTDSFEAFSYQCDKFASAVVEEARLKPSKQSSSPCAKPNRPNNRPISQNRPRVLPNPIAARRVQTLYRLSKKRAAREILNDNNTVYSGSKDEANSFFTNTFKESSIDADELLKSLNDFVPSVDEDPTILAPLTTKDIKNKLKPMANSAPGKDRVEYRHLKQVDPNCKVLETIFNRCLDNKKVPTSWKQSTTILIYKKGNSDDPSNFRPVALMSCIYKLFTALLAARVTDFAINNGLMSPQQKSARPAEGCHEHTFTLESIISDCKRNQKNCFMAWLDLKNAFGSINHQAIYVTLRHMSFSESLIELIRDIYTNASTVIHTSLNEETDPINVHAGVKQGCPISPILFNLTSELLKRSVISRSEDKTNIPFKLHNQPISILAYADDLVIISRTKEGLQDLLDEISIVADVLKLTFRQDKCATLSLTCSKKESSKVSNYKFSVQNGQIPHLEKEETYRYLGVPIGLLYDASEMKSITETH